MAENVTLRSAGTFLDAKRRGFGLRSSRGISWTGYLPVCRAQMFIGIAASRQQTLISSQRRRFSTSLHCRMVWFRHLYPKSLSILFPFQLSVITEQGDFLDCLALKIRRIESQRPDDDSLLSRPSQQECKKCLAFRCEPNVFRCRTSLPHFR